MLATIGYERSTLPDFIATLQLINTDTLVDVRERAQSRRPGFSKKALEEALSKAGIGYVHLPQLGDPKDGREAARAGKMQLFQEIYEAVISGPKAQEALNYLQGMVPSQTICLMCFERDQKDCHRRIVAEKLEDRLGVKAAHLGVVMGAAGGGRERRMLHTDQGATASI